MTWRWLNRVETCYSLLPFAPREAGDTVAPRLLDACSRTVEPIAVTMAAERGYRLTTCDRKPYQIEVEKVDLLHLPYDDATFQGVICSDTIEHVETPERALDEIARVTKPGGFLIFGVPVENDGRLSPYGSIGWRAETVPLPPGHPDEKWNHKWLMGTDARCWPLMRGYEFVAELSAVRFARMRLSMIWMYEKQ